MNGKELLRRTFALMLTLVMTLSMSVFAFEDSYAVTDEDGRPAADAQEEGPDNGTLQEDEAVSDEVTETEASVEETAGDDEPEVASDGKEVNVVASEEKSSAGTSGGDVDRADAGNTDPEGETPDNTDEPAVVTGFRLASQDNLGSGKVTCSFSWDAFEGADVYIISVWKAGDEASAVTAETTAVKADIEDLDPETAYQAKVEAFSTGGDTTQVIAVSEIIAFTTSAASLKVEVVSRDDVMTLKWPKIEGAVSYTLTKQVQSAYKSSLKFNEGKDTFTTDKTSYTFNNLFPGRKYIYSVTAVDSSGNAVITTIDPLKEQPVLTPLTKKSRSGRWVSANRKTVSGKSNLREAIGEKYDGYSVVQGGCTDGTYAYYLMVSISTQKGKVAKVKMSSNKVVKVSGVLNTWHGNGMTYDSRRHRLVVNACGSRKNELTFIDADTLKVTEQPKVSYSYYKDDDFNFGELNRSKGICSIAYSKKYDIYIANQRDYHNLIIIDPDTLKAIGLVRTSITDRYPNLYQAMDADDQYAYLLLSPQEDGHVQNNNVILALDWNAAQLIDQDGHRRKYVPELWYCANNSKPVAVYKINTDYEAENIYHITDASGNTHFYLSEHRSKLKDIKKTYKKKVKKKWKKVRKKVKVKWKKVKKKVKWKKVKIKKGKNKGKYKWKYKYKKVWKYKYKYKKVWKYKTKTKKVTKVVGSYRDRYGYVYDLGTL